MVTMATSITHPDSDQGNYFRMTILIVDYGLTVLQDVLQRELTKKYPHLFDPNTGLLCGVLGDTTVKATLFGLSPRVLNYHQRNLLHPAEKPSTSVTVGDLDFPLTVLLLRNITTLNPRLKAWDNPSDADTSTEATIGRAKRYRDVHALANKAAISDPDFRVHFSGLKSNLLSLSSMFTSEDYDDILTRQAGGTLPGHQDIQITEDESVNENYSTERVARGIKEYTESDESVNENFGTERLERDIKEYTESDIYHAACENGMQKVYKGSVIVVGQADTGKTHLCRNLLGEDFTENDKVTNGITVSGCVLDKHTADTTFRRQDKSFIQNYYKDTIASGVKEYRGSENASKSRSAHASIKVEENDETMRQIVKASEGHPDVHESVSLWDFGGQYVFYTTHQTFLTWQAVYLLVFDLTKDLNAPVHVKQGGTVKDIKVDIIPSTVGDFLKFWQNSIHALTKIVDHLGSEYICPKILLVGTHRDKLGHTEEERKKAVEEKFIEIQEYLRRRSAHDMHVQPHLYAVNNCDPGDAGIQELRQEICKTIKEQPYWGEEQPLKYVLLEKRLNEISETRKCLSLDEVLEIGTQHALVNDEMVIHFLKFYSELGELVFFNEDDTRNIVILEPQWLIDAFASLITVEKYHKGSSLEAMDYWDLLDERGELDERLIDIVWKEEAELKKNKAVLLRICQRFDLLVELQEEDADGQWKKYLVPCVLKNHPNPEGYLKIPECPSEGYLGMQKIPPLYLMFDGGFCPPGLFHRLVVCCYRKWSSHDKKPYCNYACFKVDRSTHTILELCNEGDGTFKLLVGSLKKRCQRLGQ